MLGPAERSEAGPNRHNGFWCRRAVTQGRVRSHLVVMHSPAFDQDLRHPQRVEDFTVDQLISKFAVEALDVAIFPRTARRDEQCLDANLFEPLPHGFRGELGPVVTAKVIGHTASDK